MQIETPDDLFKIYDFDDEIKREIKQYYNTDKNIVKDILALCLNAKNSRASSVHLHTNCWLIKKSINRNNKSLNSLNLVYKIDKNKKTSFEKIFFIEIQYS